MRSLIASTVLLSLGAAGCTMDLARAAAPQVACSASDMKITTHMSTSATTRFNVDCPNGPAYSCHKEGPETTCVALGGDGTDDGTGNSDSASGSPGVDVAAMMKRELSELPEPVEVKGTGWSARVPGKASLGSVEGKKAEVVSIEIGTEQPVQCGVFADAVDPASSMQMRLMGVAKQMDRMQVRPVRVYRGGELAIMAIEAKYLLSQKGQPAAGQYKLAYVDHPARSVICHHDEPGYSRTFRRVVQHVARSLKIADFEPPYSVELTRLRVGDAQVGFGRSATWKESTNTERDWEVTANLFPTKRGLMATEQIAQVVRNKRRLVSGVWVEEQNGKVSRSVVLKERKAGKHEVVVTEGEDRKTLSLRAPFPGIPRKTFDEKLLERIQLPKPFKVTKKVYSPQEAPGELTERVIEHSEEPGVVQMIYSDGRRLRLWLTPDGVAKRLEMDLPGGRQLVGELLYARSEPKTKAPKE